MINRNPAITQLLHTRLGELDSDSPVPHKAVKAPKPQPVASTVARGNRASDKQRDLLGKLGKELRELAGDDSKRTIVVNALRDHMPECARDSRKASDAITSMIGIAKGWRKEDREANRSSSPSTSGSEPEAGMYRLQDGTIVRVYLGQRSGKMLAKKLVSEGDHHEYEYMGKATRFVNADTAKLSLAEAKEFGRMTGHCCVCARRLDNPESVEAGIGPVCAGRVDG